MEGEDLEEDVIVAQDPEAGSHTAVAGQGQAAKAPEEVPSHPHQGRRKMLQDQDPEAGPDQGLGVKLYRELGMQCRITKLVAPAL